MRKIIHATAPIGLIFGVFFSVVAYVSGMQLSSVWFWLLPILTAILCIVGGAIAALIINLLSSRYFLPATTAVAIAFTIAALFNMAVVLGVASAFGIIVLHPRIFLGAVPGLGLGAAYAFYQYNVARLNERAEFLQALTEHSKQLHDASRKLAITEERNRMGRELHDSVSQGLHGLVFAIHTMRNCLTSPSPEVTGILNHMEATANATLDELRAMIEELRPSLLAELGLERALRTIGEFFSQNHSIPLDCSISIEPSLQPEIEMAIYRIAQEALANIGRHSSAEHVHLKLTMDQQKVMLIISDDGRGFDPSQLHAGNGVKNMRQRIEELGGTLKISSRAGFGTTLTAEFPLNVSSEITKD